MYIMRQAPGPGKKPERILTNDLAIRKMIVRLCSARFHVKIVLTTGIHSEDRLLFEGARVIMSIHGGALANMIFAKKSNPNKRTKIIEIHPISALHENMLLDRS